MGGTPVFPFGHGLSYTSFRFSWAREPATTLDTRAVSWTPTGHRSTSYVIKGTNTGDRVGDCVVLAFVSTVAGMARTPSSPRKKLFWFKRVRALAPGLSEDVLVEAPASGVHLSTTMSDGTRWLAPGAFIVEVG